MQACRINRIAIPALTEREQMPPPARSPRFVSASLGVAGWVERASNCYLEALASDEKRSFARAILVEGQAHFFHLRSQVHCARLYVPGGRHLLAPVTLSSVNWKSDLIV